MTSETIQLKMLHNGGACADSLSKTYCNCVATCIHQSPQISTGKVLPAPTTDTFFGPQLRHCMPHSRFFCVEWTLDTRLIVYGYLYLDYRLGISQYPLFRFSLSIHPACHASHRCITHLQDQAIFAVACLQAPSRHAKASSTALTSLWKTTV